ncbi:hypothetical protein V6R21_12990 [Limibacter armeniacum]|uniref:hypothetical protein n=1 Tax=Limibacter armeniacum TaxID=466084 RepID=UPI002FE5169D
MTTTINRFSTRKMPSSVEEAQKRLLYVTEELTKMQQQLLNDVSFSLSVDFQKGFKELNRQIMSIKSNAGILLNDLRTETLQATLQVESNAVVLSQTLENFLNRYKA